MSEEDVRQWNKWFYETVKEMRRWQHLYFEEGRKLKAGTGNQEMRHYYMMQSMSYEKAVDAEIQRIEEIKQMKANEAEPSIDFGEY